MSKLFVAALLPLFIGCTSVMYSTTGDVMTSFNVDHVLPTMLASDDVQLACSTGESFLVFFQSFARVMEEPSRALLITYVPAAFCAEMDSRESALAELRAFHSGNGSLAIDARIVEKQQHAVAAERFATAYALLERAYGPVGDDCPTLNEDDQVIYLLGLASGLNAVLHDKSGGGATNVPLTIPLAVARAATCLDNQKWFGLPEALRAAVWTTVPGSAPVGVDPFKELAAAAQLGDAAGVRFAHAMQVQALELGGRVDEQRAAITDFAGALVDTSRGAAYRLLDRIGLAMVQHSSDKLWTKNLGHRTPSGALGQFPDVGNQESDFDDSMLDDLDG